jgi:chromosome segregation ATPase
MVDDKIKVCARVPSNIYDICLQRYDNITNAINAGLELLCRQECPTNRVDNSGRLEKELTINDNIVQELKERMKNNDEKDREIINNLKDQTYSLDNQLRTKDNQIENLNENMHKQAVHIQTLIQEISQLNVKLIPENTENKKPWYKFW